MDPKVMTPIIMGALLVFVIYRRMRRTFGRQTVNVGRMWGRIVVLLLVGCLVAYGAVRSVTSLEALLAGILGGAALSYLGLKHTQFEVTAEGRFYTPHTYIGLIVSALFLGRLVYRLAVSYGSAQAAAQAGAQAAPPNLATTNTPLTVALFGVLITYYVVFNFGVLQKTKGPPSQPAT